MGKHVGTVGGQSNSDGRGSAVSGLNDYSDATQNTKITRSDSGVYAPLFLFIEIHKQLSQERSTFYILLKKARN